MSRSRNVVLVLRGFLLIAAVTLLVAACSGDEALDEPEAEAVPDEDGPSGTLTIVVGEGPQGLDPNAASSREHIALGQILEGLIELDPQTFEYSGVLAESWELTSPTTWEFKLREGVTFTNGEAFDSASVKYSLERTVDPEITSIPGFDNRPRYDQADIAEITTPDDYTVIFELNEPNPLFLSLIEATVWMLPPSTADVSPQDVNNGELVGTGPYMVAEFVPGEILRYEPNPNYWGEGPYLEEVVLREVPEGSSRAGELEAGSADVAGGLPAQSIAALEENPDIELTRTGAPRRRILQMRTVDSVFEDTRVRQAVAHGVNRELIVEQVFGGNATVLASVVNIPHLDPDLEPHAYDPDRSRALLEEAGLPDGFSETLYYQSGDPVVTESMQAVQSQLAEVGIDLELAPTERAVLLEMLVDKSITLSWWDQGLYGDGGRDIDSVVSGINGLSLYSDPRFDELYDAQEVEIDAEARAEMIREIDHIMYEQVPVLPLWTVDEMYGVRSTVQGFDPGLAGYWFFKEASIAE